MLRNFDLFVIFTLAVILIIGFYQFYFWCQRNHQRAPKTFDFWIDKHIPLKSGWIWIYSGLYYPLIIVMVFIMRDFKEFCYIVFDFFVLMTFQMLFFVYFPVITPKSWRDHSDKKPTLSLKFLNFVQRLDKPNNCFPSMHVSVATLTSCHMYLILQNHEVLLILFPILIALSAIYTKQHYVMDLILGAILGLFAFWLYGFMI